MVVSPVLLLNDRKKGLQGAKVKEQMVKKKECME